MSRTVFLQITLLVVAGGAFIGPGFADDSPMLSADSSFLKLASWNIRIFSNSRTDEQLRMICKVAKQFDFIAIMELRDEAVLKRMAAMLKSEYGRTYVYELSPYVGNTRENFLGFFEDEEDERGSRELYAFFYDPNLVRCTKQGQLYDDSLFFRKPYYATFKAGSFDFTAIVIHVIWGDTVGPRRKEVNRLAYVYGDLQNQDPLENDILLMGDFNCDADDDLAWGPLHTITGMIHLFNLPEKSMIWDTHLYDNTLFQSNYVREYTLDCGIVRFDEIDFGNNDKDASAAVSDHRPVWSLYRIDGHDDD